MNATLRISWETNDPATRKDEGGAPFAFEYRLPRMGGLQVRAVPGRTWSRAAGTRDPEFLMRVAEILRIYEAAH